MSVTLALLVALAQPSAGVPPRTFALTDERLARIGDPRSILVGEIQDSIFDDPQMVSAFRRVGIGEGCAIYNRALRSALARHEPRLTPFVVSAMRRHVPPEVLAVPTGWHTNALMPYHRRILAELADTAADIFSRARDEIAAAFLEEAASLPAAPPASAAGEFSDWDLERPLARQTACMIVRTGPPEGFAARKGPFDGFYRRDSR